MATELGFLSLTQHKRLAQSQENQNHNHNQQHHHQPDTNFGTGSWMWYTTVRPHKPDDDSWEVRAFAEDTSNAMGATWPPSSYTCTFCRREFRSAQALGGHMNVHRRDRGAALLHQTQTGGGGGSNAALINTTSSISTITASSSSSLLIRRPTQEFVTNGGLCLLYQLDNPNGVFTSPPPPPPPMNAWSIDSQYPTYNSMAVAATFPISSTPVFNTSSSCSTSSSSSSSFCYSMKVDHSMASADHNLNQEKNISNCSKETSINEELDLELRLGHRGPRKSA